MGNTEINRGCLTDEIQNLAKEYLGREITTTELRLYPYIDYCIKNGGYMDRSKMNGEEIDILHNYNEKIQLRRDRCGYVSVTKEFYDYMQKVLWISYVEDKLGV